MDDAPQDIGGRFRTVTRAKMKVDRFVVVPGT